MRSIVARVDPGSSRSTTPARTEPAGPDAITGPTTTPGARVIADALPNVVWPPSPSATQLASPNGWLVRARTAIEARAPIVRELLAFVSPGAVAAVMLGLSGCATTRPGGVAGAPLGGSGRTPPPMDQTDYPTLVLGEGHYTIAQSGCLLTSLTMASAWLHRRTDLDPPRANRLVMAADGFSGSGLELSRAAPALGLRVVDRSAMSASNRTSLVRALDASLDSGRPVVLGVDFQPGRSSQASDADHFILAFRRLDPGRYAAMDPAGGREVELVADANGAMTYRGADDRHITEMIFLAAAPFTRDPATLAAR